MQEMVLSGAFSSLSWDLEISEIPLSSGSSLLTLDFFAYDSQFGTNWNQIARKSLVPEVFLARFRVKTVPLTKLLKILPLASERILCYSIGPLQWFQRFVGVWFTFRCVVLFFLALAETNRSFGRFLCVTSCRSLLRAPLAAPMASKLTRYLQFLAYLRFVRRSQKSCGEQWL